MNQYSRREIIIAGVGAAAAIATVAALPGCAHSEPATGACLGERVIFNRGYRFTLGDTANAEAAGFDDKDWADVDLPHSFSTPYWAKNTFYVGYGWYRKRFHVGPEWAGRHLSLEIEAAFQDAEVFVNGVKAGSHQGGYTAFAVDLTAFVKPGDNLFAVRLNNLWNPELAPRAGEHQFSGGIYRNVWLRVSDPVHIPMSGSWVTTPQVSAQSAVVHVQTQILNAGDRNADVLTTIEIADPKGTVVGRSSKKISVSAGSTAAAEQTLPAIADPQLWHPDHPHLYKVTTTVFRNGVAIDSLVQRIGLRWFSFTADKGFFLNGAHYLLRGVNVHQDHAGWGDATSDAASRRDVQMVKDAGFTFIRGSHYPHAPAFYRACDELGILLWSELNFWGIGGGHREGSWFSSAYPSDAAHAPAFEASCKQQLAEMITQHRNSPSVVVWSMCNEVFFSDASVMPNVKQLLLSLVALSHELDPHRPAGIGGCQRGEIDKLGDIAGYNGDGATLYLDPGVASLVSEYGSCGGERPGAYDPCWGDTAGQPDFPWRSGKALWCMFDHGSNANIGDLGCVNYFRLPKRRWYWYRNANRGIAPPAWPEDGTPARLGLSADKTTIEGDGTDDCLLTVTVLDAQGKHISNSPPVTLKIKSGPGLFPTGPEIPFANGTDIPIIDGQAAIELHSHFAGATLIEATSPGLLPANLVINTVGAPKYDPSARKPVPIVLNEPKSGSALPAPAAGDLALLRPTLASSQESKNISSYGNDGNQSTRWCAISGAAGAWWQVDLENIDIVTKTVITFERAVNYRYTIALSMDGTSWTTVVNQSQSTSSDQMRTDNFPKNAKGRYLKITYTGLPAGTYASHYELAVYGAPVH